MISISQGKIRLENKIIDTTNFEVRPKASEKDLEVYYDSLISHAEEAGDYFEDKTAFDTTLREASEEKRPKLIARETKYPFLWWLRTSFMPFDFLKPSKRRLHDKYFIVAHCTTLIPTKTEPGKEKPLDDMLREDISEKFKKYPGYEGIIEIPNDRTPPQTKSTTFHESLHYLLMRYQAGTGRNFVKAFIKKPIQQIEKYQVENMLHERCVEMLTDKLLTHDSDAQFENRWLYYSNKFTIFAMGTSALATGVLLAYSINKPYLLPIALVPSKIRDYALEKHKKSKKEEILKPVKYPKFKI